MNSTLKQLICPFISLLGASLVLTFGALCQAEESPPVKELAPFMGELQRLTHKLSLSAQAGNAELAGFYMYESIEVLKAIQEEVPEYRGLPIAVFVDRFGLPSYTGMQKLLNDSKGGILDARHLMGAMNLVIENCNKCHDATQHGFIRITEARSNPFNQVFNP